VTQRVLVVGCGSIGTRHAANLLALGVEQVLACDPDPDRLAALTSRHSLEGFESLEAALAAGPDAVLICTPNHTHVPIALAAARAGCHLFVEKPLSHTLEGVAELRDLVQRHRLTALGACEMRFYRPVATLKRLIDDGAVGRVLAVQNEFGHYLPNWRPAADYRRSYSARGAEGGGIVLDAIQDLDYLMWFLGDVAGVFCAWARVSDLEIDTEDTANMVLRFQSGALGSLHLDYTQRFKRRRSEVVGSEGTLIWEGRGKTPDLSTIECYTAGSEQWRQVEAAAAVDPNECYVDEMQHFLRCLEGREAPRMSLDQAEKVLRVALGAKRSGETGEECREL
jgi:predicted dehydrogenase